MKKLPNPKWLLPVALGAGAVGCLLRFWLFRTGIDERGLLPQNHIVITLVMILTAVFLLGSFLWLRIPLRKVAYQKLFPASSLAAGGCWLAAFGIALADISELDGTFDRFTVISLVISFAAIAALVFLGLRRWQGQRPHPVLHGIVTVYLMLHLVYQYRPWSTETQLQVYFFPLMASVFLMLSTYHRATVDAGFGKLSSHLFFHYGALFFCLSAAGTQQPTFHLAMVMWLATADCRPVLSSDPLPLPQDVLVCMDRLKAAGYQRYVVGGCVRDLLLDLTPQDYDICTNATPEQTAEVFSDCTLVRSGEKHGTIGVVMDGQVYEITTFRTEGGYSDSRHPDWVEFVPTVQPDLARRDFTINAMAYCPETGLLDPYKGQKDMDKQVLRTVGDPTARFTEDALRILRGVRFAVRFHLTPEPQTEKAMKDLAPTMEKLAVERVFSELCKLLPRITAEDLLRYREVITQVIPELRDTVGFQQHSPHHAYDVYTHTAYVVENAPHQLPLRLAALLHDVGKPSTFQQDEQGIGHFYEHAGVSADMADAALSRLRAPTALRQQVVLLIRQHMSPLTPDKKLLRRRLAQYGEDTLRQQLALQKADRAGQGVKRKDTDSDAALALLETILQEQSCFSLKELAIDGNDLLEAGFAPGPEIGAVLNALLDKVVEQQLPNDKNTLLEEAKTMRYQK